MTQVCDIFDDVNEFEDLLEEAEGNASTDWEMDFCQDIRDRFDQWAERMYLSEAQQASLERIARRI